MTRVKVRRAVIVEVHRDHDPEKRLTVGTSGDRDDPGGQRRERSPGPVFGGG